MGVNCNARVIGRGRDGTAPLSKRITGVELSNDPVDIFLLVGLEKLANIIKLYLRLELM